MKCQQCGSEAVMISGVCLNCSFRNPPKIDKAKEVVERRRQAEEQARQREQETLATARAGLEQIRILAEQGNMSEAWNALRELQTPNTVIVTEKKRLEAELWKHSGLPEKQLEVLEGLQNQLPFTQENLAFYYDLACLLQRQDSPGKAFHIFQQFIDNHHHTYRSDVLERYRSLKKSGVIADAGPGASGSHRVFVGGMQQTVESLRGWIDQANRVPEYFRDSILINQDDYEHPVRVEKSYSGEISLSDLLTAVRRDLSRAGLDAFQAEEQHLALQFGGPQGQQKPATTLVLRPISGTALNFDAGTIRLGIQVDFIGRTGVSLNHYEFFTPARPEDSPGRQPDIRDFNDAIGRAVMDIHNTPDPRRHALLTALRDQVKKSIEAELESCAQSGVQSFF